MILKLLPIIALTIPLLLIWNIAHGRAGGGEGFGGGGGFSGGEGGGGGGGGGIIIWLIIEYLVIEHPVIGIPVLIIAGIFYYQTHTSVAGYVRDQRTQSGLAAVDENAEATALQELQQSDPAFDLQKFYGRVNTGFLKIQDAWCTQNLQTIRPFISDGVQERFGLQFTEQKLDAVHDRMRDIQVRGIQMVQLIHDQVFDSATVRIIASAVDQTISTVDGRVISGSDEAEEFTEYWSFLRRRGATTPNGAGLIEGHCPNCGAAIAINEGAQCQSCHALLRSGQYDWVLAEITQGSEWVPETSAATPGLPEMQTRDPNFTLAGLEDRVSVIFWRKVLADRLGKVDPLRKVAAASFLQRYGPLLAMQSNGVRAFWGDCAVGTVRTIGVLGGSPMDRALVEVRWSSRRYQTDASGKAQKTPQSNLARHLMVLERQFGVKTDPDQGISSAHCPKCGAPVMDDISNACSFCGTVLNDGTSAWILLDMLPVHGQAAQELLGQLAASQPTSSDSVAQPVTDPPHIPPPSSGLLAWMVQCVASNGDIDEAEERMLRHTADRRGVSEEQLQRMLDAAAHGQLQVTEPKTPDAIQRWLGAMVTAALSDGEITSTEQQLITRVGQKYGLSAYDIKMLIRRQQDQLYATAKNALSDRRRRLRSATVSTVGSA
ncbi:MAG: TIM44-like domain-containing protein [Phycisphaerae bacterium]